MDGHVARADRGVPGPAAGHRRHPGGHPARGQHAAACRRRCCPQRTGCDVYLKVEGANPTGSFKDRGMTVAVSKAVEAGAKAIICASTGNTSRLGRRVRGPGRASPARCSCPQGKIALGKLAQALVHGARLLQVDGNFDDCLALASQARAWTTRWRWSTRSTPTGCTGRRPPRSRSSRRSATRPDIHCLPVGNAGNITAYWMGYREDHDGRQRHPKRPKMYGFQAAGAAPIVDGAGGAASRRPSPPRSGSATRPRWTKALDARDDSGGLIDAVTDREILAAYRLLAREVGVFVELGSAASVAGLLQPRRGGHGAARLDGGLHGHRPRPQGPGVGDLHRAGADHHRQRRPGRRPRPRPGLTRRVTAAGVRRSTAR